MRNRRLEIDGEMKDQEHAAEIADVVDGAIEMAGLAGMHISQASVKGGTKVHAKSWSGMQVLRATFTPVGNTACAHHH